MNWWEDDMNNKPVNDYCHNIRDAINVCDTPMTTKEFKLTTKSQVTIPETIKEVLGISAGDAIVFDVNKDGSISSDTIGETLFRLKKLEVKNKPQLVK